MMVDKDYVPTETSIVYLENKHYTRKHIWDIVQKFRINFNGQEFQNIEEKFKKVMCKEFATNTPKKPIDNSNPDRSHKSKDSAIRAANVKKQSTGMTKQQAIAWYDEQRGIINNERSKGSYDLKGGCE